MVIPFLVWWALLVVLGRALAPALTRTFASFPERGYAFAKPLALISLGYVSWLATSLGLEHGMSLGLGLALLAAVWLWTRRGVEPRPLVEQLRDEGIFLAALIFFAFVRSLEPDIFGAEKYMDFAFFNTLERASHFPPEDPWMSGAPINYYYFGYLLFSNLARLTDVAPAVAYNLSIATVGAILMSGAMAIGFRLTGRLGYGLLGAVATALLGNLDGFWQLVVERKGLAGFDWWRSSRVVANTINEFPFFSLLHGDLHPHVTAVVIDVSLIGVAIAAAETLPADPAPQRRLREMLPAPLPFGLLALLFGALSLTNPWDLPVYLSFLGLVFGSRLWRSAPPLHALTATALALAVVVGAGLLLSLPFTLHFHAPFHGVGRVHDQTALGSFLMVFGLLLVPPMVYVMRSVSADLPSNPEVRELTASGGTLLLVVLYVATSNWVLILMASMLVAVVAALTDERTERDFLAALCLLGVAVLALFACEVVYLRDAYGSALHRMNTVFKLYFQAWIFLAVGFPEFVRRGLSRFSRRPIFDSAATGILVAAIAAALCYPAATIALRARHIDAGHSLDGLAYLDREHSDDAAAVRWLASQKDLPVVVEATGDPYSYFARVSSNSGLPTVLGWANHEGVWRGADPRISERKHDVDTIYKTEDAELASKMLQRYRVRFVFVGELERKEYPAEGLKKFEANSERFPLAFQSGATAVFSVP